MIPNDTPKRLKTTLIIRLAIILLAFFAGLGAILFGVAGTFNYPGAWMLLGTFFIVAVGLFAYWLNKDPEFLRKRMDYSEREKTQKKIIAFSFFPFLAIFVLPPLDVRFGWTRFSWPLIGIGEALFVIFYVAVMAVFKANRFASRTVKIQEGQKVIDTGPYAIVRHPMYACVVPVYAGIALILQSCWGLTPLPLILLVLILRIKNEEKILREGLPGYAEYCKKVRWRLVPFIW